MRKITVAQIGTNYYSHGPFAWESIVKQSDIFDVKGYALPENERERLPEQVKRFEGHREMTVKEILEDPEIEAVVIETDEIYLTKYALMVAQAGKHIHMEKPGGIELANFEKLIETVKKSGKVFHTGYLYRYNPCMIELMEQIKRGELGEIISVEAQMNCLHSKEVREWLKNFPSGMLFFLGCHMIDMIFRIQGPPEEIIPLSCSTGADGVKTDDFGMAVMRYKNGVSIAKAHDSQFGGFVKRSLVVTGTKATVELSPLEMYADNDMLFTEKTDFTNPNWGDTGTKSKSQPFVRMDGMLSAFASYVRGEKENPYTPDYELELYKTILKCCGVD